jgi:hypothetical protein
MSAIAVEFVESRTGSGESRDLIYKISGTSDDAAARTALLDAAPATHDGLGRVDLRCSVAPEFIDEDSGDGIWTGTAVYAAPDSSKAKERPKTGDRVLSFDTSGGTQHITQGLGTVWSGGEVSEIVEDFQGAIGVTHDSVEGCDIFVPTFKFSITAYIADADMTAEYIGKLYALTGKVNDDEITVAGLATFTAGEVLFLDAAGSQRGDGSDWEVQWHFAASPNKTGITVGDIQNIEKKGWEYLWVRYEDTDDSAAKSLVKRPTAVYIEKVLEKLVPWDAGYAHGEGNSAAHLKATLVGFTAAVPVERGQLCLGTWQGIYFCEFDGPRNRKVIIKIIEG